MPVEPLIASTSLKRCVSSAITSSQQRVQQRLCLFEIGHVEALGEPAVDRREEVAGFSASALVAAQPGEARGGAQLPEFGLLLPGDAQGFAVKVLGGIGLPLTQQQLAFVPVELRRQPALPCPFDDLQGIVQQGQGLVNLPCDLTCPGQEGVNKGHPQLRPGGAESSRTTAQDRYPSGHIAIFDRDPAAIDRSDRTVLGETLFGRHRNQLVYPPAEDCAISVE